MDRLIQHVPLLMGLISFVGGFATWYAAAVKKQYAAERDFGHLKRSYDSLSTNIAHLDRQLDQRLDELQRENLELRTLLQGVLLRLGSDGSTFFQNKE